MDNKTKKLSRKGSHVRFISKSYRESQFISNVGFGISTYLSLKCIYQDRKGPSIGFIATTLGFGVLSILSEKLSHKEEAEMYESYYNNLLQEKLEEERQSNRLYQSLDDITIRTPIDEEDIYEEDEISLRKE